MKKTLIIIGRELRTRLRRPMFWVVAALVPAALVLLYALPLIIPDPAEKQHTVLVVDETGLFEGAFSSTERLVYRSAPTMAYAAKLMADPQGHITAAVFIPARDVSIPHDAFLYYRTTPPPAWLQADVAEQLHTILRNNILLDVYNISPADYHLLQTTRVKVRTQDIESGREAHTAVRTATGAALAALAVLAVLLFGGSVLRGVAEEKTSRIAELTLSSASPLQLMAGKVAGIGVAGVLQFLVWVLLAGGGMAAVRTIWADRFANAAPTTLIATKGVEATAQLENAQTLTQSDLLLGGLEALNMPLIAIMFLIYFVLGYLLYATLYAGAGASRHGGETTGTVLLIALPLIATLLLGPAVMAAPSGALAVTLTLFPLTAPAAALLRLPFGIAMWQVAASLLLMIAALASALVLAAKTYRRNILSTQKG
ncbi:MAG: ABC transporter permease [Bacteroidales bacterium]|nr:ABC transporter permease [Bacteroidales bacterium]